MHKTTLFLFLFLTLQLQGNSQSTFQIATQAGAFHPEYNQGFINENVWGSLPDYQGYKYLMIQFEVMPDAKVMKLIHEKGIELISYLPKNTYYMKVP
jgi:hypothetical protein